MPKHLLVAVLSAATGVVITKLIADRKIIELQRENNRKQHDWFSYAFSAGWDGGMREGRKNMWIEAATGKLPETWT